MALQKMVSQKSAGKKAKDMKNPIIYIGADHAGFPLKKSLISTLCDKGYEVVDCGAHILKENDDYSEYAEVVARNITKEKNTLGILICGSGQGMCIVANRFAGIRAVSAWDEKSAHASRNDDDANILCLGARFLSSKKAAAVVMAWLSTPFAKEARFVRRIKKIDAIKMQ